MEGCDSIVGGILQTLCTKISRETGYVRHLKENVDALMEEDRKLKALCEDTEREGREASRGRKRLTNQAQTWLDQARTIQAEIDSIKLQFDQRQSFCNGCFPDLWSDYTLGKRALEKLERVRRDINERSGIKLVAMSSPPRVKEMDVPTVGQSSAQRTKEKIWNLLHDEHTSVIYIYGMGGIGKTTLMKAINKKLKATREFDYVIWVTVSKEFNLERVQKEIMGWLRLDFSEQDSYSNRSMQLHQYLTDKRYMLILDDLWNPINLIEIGLPTNKENRSKIVITTRIANMPTVQVFSDMKVEKIRVETLTEDEAWDLFAANVGKEVVHQPHIEDVAKAVAKKCGGLPLAIVAVAKAMEGQSMRELWQDALRALRASAPEIEGMEPEVFRPLKKSYDDLRDEKVKMCFLYCSLFPEDYEISVKQLIRWWIMEGFIDNVNNLADASNKGHRIIEELKRRCLLEEGIRDDGVRVKMHDVIRDLALYIASSSCNEGPKFLVIAKKGLNEPPPEGTWREFERISLMMNDITELPVKPECPNLISLLLRENHRITAVPHSFFELMPALQVLDLSYTSITSLSVSSSSLLNLRALILRGCYTLRETPFLGQLKELQFLDIKSSGIRRLPEEMQNLVKLKKLNILEEVIEGHDKSLPENPFPQLRNFTLLQLPKLKSIIHRDTFALPSLIKLEIVKCPRLRLPNRPDTTDWPSITAQGMARWEANPQRSEQRAFHYCNQDVGHAIAALTFAAMPLRWDVKLFDELGFSDLQRVMGSELSFASKTPLVRLKVSSPTWNSSTLIALSSYFPTSLQNFRFIIRR
ncbi:hypothetical protein AAC387_Pa06g2321 [Persea americana]